MAKVKIDVRDLIMEKMKDEGRSFSWLSKKTGIPYNTLYACIMRKSFSINQDNLSRINSALNTNYSVK